MRTALDSWDVNLPNGFSKRDRILVVDEDQTWKTILSKVFSPDQQVHFCQRDRGLVEIIAKESFDLVVLDLPSWQLEKGDLLRKIREVAPGTPIIVTSESAKAEVVVKAIKLGAFDFVEKPYTAAKIRLSVAHALENRSMKNEIDYLRREQDVIYDWEKIISVSPAMQAVIATLKKLANTDSTILMTGETGTGKSFLSGTIHSNSHRRKKPFITVNCANIPETLLESELFGHEKGAFTDASKMRMGRFEQGNGGTVFLDEIGELSPALQAKLLRVLEEKSFERLGGNQTIYSDIRIVAATNRNVEKLVSDGVLREDLYYRINVLRVHLPPVRERPECIERLAEYLLAKNCRIVKKHIEGFAPEVMEVFKRYCWPGNIRQLSNTIERAVLLEEDRVIGMESISLPGPIALQAHEKPPVLEDRDCESQSLITQERDLILAALNRCLWIQKDAADRLGITPRALNYKIRKFGISHPRWRKNK